MHPAGIQGHRPGCGEAVRHQALARLAAKAWWRTMTWCVACHTSLHDIVQGLSSLTSQERCMAGQHLMPGQAPHSTDISMTISN
jgi:hypothetical protein